MKRSTGGRRNPPRQCRVSPRNKKEPLPKEVGNSEGLSEQQYKEDENQLLQSNFAEGPADSDHSEYVSSDLEESVQEEDNSSSDFEEEEEVKQVRPKRTAAPKKSSQRKRTKSRHAESKGLTRNADSIGLSAKQTELLDQIFSELDPHKNGRITISDIVRVAEDHGLGYGTEEVRDMVRFWDTSGTVTISRETFMRLAVEAKFMTPAAT